MMYGLQNERMIHGIRNDANSSSPNAIRYVQGHKWLRDSSLMTNSRQEKQGLFHVSYNLTLGKKYLNKDKLENLRNDL